ncbi:hypothetical protein FH972_027250 [Carpinus fangiana]|uniref:Uncharacterized protein n=1 Tax=Carpinus fangiana TaxID=176857 RepID=A0A5N6L767_9ROSI|nr:hypothetical protein FH972_027250 [Carpinus fangiana]
MKTKSVFYKITLEQYWEEIYSQGNNAYGGNIVILNTNKSDGTVGLSSAVLEGEMDSKGMRVD